MNPNFIPVKKVLEIINSCETSNQLKICLKLINNYTKSIKNKGITNPDLVEKRLLKEYKQKKFQITMIKHFIRIQHKVFYEAIV